MESTFIEVGIVGLRVFFSMLPLILFKYLWPDEEDIFTDKCMKWATTFYFVFLLVTGFFLDSFFHKNALIRIPIPYHPDTILSAIAFQTPDIIHILSLIWIIGVVLLIIVALILSKKGSKAFWNRITVVNAIFLWYNPLYWWLVKITPPAKDESENEQPKYPRPKVLILLVILCLLFTFSSFLLVDCTYTLPESADIVRILGSKYSDSDDFDFFSRYDQKDAFGTPYVSIDSHYNSKRLIDYISWNYPKEVEPEEAWDNIQPIIDRLTELLGPGQQQPPTLLYTTLATNRIQWVTQAETGETATIELHLLPYGSFYNDEIKGTASIKLLYKLKQP